MPNMAYRHVPGIGRADIDRFGDKDTVALNWAVVGPLFIQPDAQEFLCGRRNIGYEISIIQPSFSTLSLALDPAFQQFAVGVYPAVAGQLGTVELEV